MPALEIATQFRQRIDEAVQTIAKRTAFRPKIGLIVGSGLGGFTSALKVDTEIYFADIPHMPSATSPGHEGKLVLGILGSQRLAVMSGRFHYYEGYSPTQIVFPVRLLQALGAESLFITSIVGSMNPKMPPGSLVLLEDHINLMGMNPLIGPNDDALGVRFPDMSAPYDVTLRGLARQVASEQDIALPEGVYVAVAGPNLETRAEYRLLRQVGADVVGMSVVPEVIAARHGGLRVLAITVVSDACIPEDLKPTSVEELLRVAAETEPQLTAVLQGVIVRFDSV